MIFAVVLVLVIGLAVALVVAVAKNPGPSPTEIALGYEHASELRDFDVLYRLSGPELHEGFTKADFIAAKRAASSSAPKSVPAVEETIAEAELREGNAAAVRTRLTLNDGSVVHHEVRLQRRSRAWLVVAYERRGAPAS